ESVKQVAVADRLVLTKADLVAETPGALMDRLATLNPSAPVLPASFGDIEPTRLFDTRIWDPSAPSLPSPASRGGVGWGGGPPPPPPPPPRRGGGVGGGHQPPPSPPPRPHPPRRTDRVLRFGPR